MNVFSFSKFVQSIETIKTFTSWRSLSMLIKVIINLLLYRRSRTVVIYGYGFIYTSYITTVIIIIDVTEAFTSSSTSVCRGRSLMVILVRFYWIHSTVAILSSVKQIRSTVSMLRNVSLRSQHLGYVIENFYWGRSIVVILSLVLLRSKQCSKILLWFQQCWYVE